VGYFPIDGEMYSCIVVMRRPGKSPLYGSASAAVTKELAEQMYINQTTWSINQISTNENAIKVPSKSGCAKRLRNATHRLGIDLVGNTDAERVRTTAEDNRIRITDVTQNFDVNSVKDMGLKDAVYFLEKAGYTVRLNKNNYVGTVREIKRNGKYVELTLR